MPTLNTKFIITYDLNGSPELLNANIYTET